MSLTQAGVAIVPLHTGFSAAQGVELTAFLLIGLLGGAHCLGMCGPLVTMYAQQFSTGTAGDSATDGGTVGATPVSFRELRQHFLFNAGRTVSYAALGGLFGLAGALVFNAADAVLLVSDTVQAVVGTLIGLVIVAAGVRHLLGGDGGAHLGGSLPLVGRLTGLFGALQARTNRWANGPGIVGLGLVHGLLPCPLLYPAYLYAFARGDPVAGVLTLAVLGLGTFPTLFVYGTIVNSVDATHRARLHRALGVAFVILGLMPIAHGLGAFGVPIPHVEPPIYQPLGG
ncbi:sulfite exporter TauE/SafE family protein [Halorientalis marina]|uniref:sulfite exporter TauE/SafE family protein n=1 Tax=Halorientalis marina TaxID=2931976 RepID=UPI001FF650DE|nr:sulfite exporter TauE/SafE family protein [Halorientalis marina]